MLNCVLPAHSIASTQEQRQKLGTTKASFEDATEEMLRSSESLGTETLIKLLKNYCRSANIKKVCACACACVCGRTQARVRV